MALLEPDTQCGSARWIGELVCYRGAMVAAAGRVLRDADAAEDVVQDVLLDLWLRPHLFDASRGSLRSYALMLARSRALDRWRSRAAHAAASDRAAREAMSAPSAAVSAADVAMRRDTAAELTRVVDDLPDAQRDAVLLAYGRGLTAQEVAKAVDIPLGTAKSRLRLGLRRARVAMEPNGRPDELDGRPRA